MTLSAFDEILSWLDDRIYGLKLLIEKLKDKPFFVENNDISAEPTSDPHQWKFSRNPIYCKIGDESLENISIFLLHVFQFTPKLSGNTSSSLLNAQVNAFDELINQIISELDKSTEFEVIIAAFNVLSLMEQIFFRSLPSTIMNSDSKCYINIRKKLCVLQAKVKNEYDIENHGLKILLCTVIMKLITDFVNALDLTKHKDLKNETLIVSEERVLYDHWDEFNPKYNGKDDYYRRWTASYGLDEISDLVKINFFSPDYYPILSNFPKIVSLEYPNYESSDENSLTCKENVNILKSISKLRKNPQDASKITDDEFFEFVIKFAINFCRRKKRKNDKNEYIILRRHEVFFLFEYITELMMVLNNLHELNMNNFAHLIPVVLRVISVVMNYVRYTEILNLDFMYYAYQAVKYSFELLEHLISGPLAFHTPINIFMILTKLINIMSKEEHEDTVDSFNDYPVEMHFQTVRFIEKGENIPRVRELLWKDILLIDSTAGSALSRYRPKSCILCSYRMTASSLYGLLLCGHSFCYSCIGRFARENLSLVCPICRFPCREIVLSDCIEEICRKLESTKEN